jgi:transcription elongation factor Elf1
MTVTCTNCNLEMVAIVVKFLEYHLKCTNCGCQIRVDLVRKMTDVNEVKESEVR